MSVRLELLMFAAAVCICLGADTCTRANGIAHISFLFLTILCHVHSCFFDRTSLAFGLVPVGTVEKGRDLAGKFDAAHNMRTRRQP